MLRTEYLNTVLTLIHMMFSTCYLTIERCTMFSGIPCPELTVPDGNATDVLGVFEDIVWVKCDVGYIIRKSKNKITDYRCRLV